MALTPPLRCTPARSARPRPAQLARSARPARASRTRRTRAPDVAATFGAVVAIVLCLATSRWWSPLVSVPLGVATALLIQHAIRKG